MGHMPDINQRPSGIWEYRRRVPTRLRKVIGKTEWRPSLGTKDLAEAKRRVAAVIADIERQIAAAGQIVTLDHQRITALAAEWLSAAVEKHEAAPPDDDAISHALDALEAAGEGRRHYPEGSDSAASESHRSIVQHMAGTVDDLLHSRNLLAVDQASRDALAVALYWQEVTYWKTMTRRLHGDYGPVPGLANAPKFVPPVPAGAADADAPTSFASVWKLWVNADEHRAPKTVYEWGKKWDKLVAYVREHHGHEDAARVTKEQARAWVESLKSAQLHPKTINFGYVAVARAAYKVACEAGVLTANPFAGLAVKINKLAQARDRRQGFTDEEARAYLQAARARGGWVRWVVSVMAYSGCRLEEVTDARACDVREEKGVPVLDINLEGEGRRLRECQKFCVRAG